MGGISETGVWSLDVAKKRHRYDPSLAARIVEFYQPEKTADVGCGPGYYCAFFKEHGWPVVHGYEGTPGIEDLDIYDDIMQVDLTKRRWVGIDYDLVVCLEVGEHIPEKYEQVFLDNLCEYVAKDSVLSWAVPGQGGKGHFNERSNEYVIGELSKRGLKFDERKSMKLRKSASLRWFKSTLMVFRRRKSSVEN